MKQKKNKSRQVQIENPKGYKLPTVVELAGIVNFIIERKSQWSSYSITIIFVSDEFMVDLNRRYFQKSEPTDVIAFNLEDDPLEAELYIDMEQTKIQAEQYRVPIFHEIFRLLIHGILHLLGYEDKTQSGKKQMKSLEDEYLQHYINKY